MYRNAIPDILPGSTWIDGQQLPATIRAAAGGYVVFTRETGVRPLRLEVMHENDFRRAWSPIYDRAAIRSQFSMSLANLGEFRVYWLPERRRIITRSVCCTRHFAVPEGAQIVGTFAEPCKSEAFFEALDLVVRTSAEPARERALA